MKWKKMGRIYCPEGKQGWTFQFAMSPVPVLINNKLRIFTGFCDENNVGRIGYVDCNPENPSEIYGISESPVLDIGRKGCFDDNGVVPVSALTINNKIYLYYVGFQLGVKVPYYMFGGLAISDDGNSFVRYSESPILDRINDEVYARCGIYVLRDENIYKMWYVGSIKEGWTMSGKKLRPLYTMKYLTSDDGIHWGDKPINCMEFKDSDEHGFGKPYVWREKNRLRMLSSIRTYSHGYYIGYAESDNGILWERMDDRAGISLSDEGWDSENISYPVLFSYKEKTYMFYNGNACGKSGFGFAELVRD